MDNQAWRDLRKVEICGVFDEVESTSVCWALFDGYWLPARLIDFNDLPDPEKGADRTCLDNVPTLNNIYMQSQSINSPLSFGLFMTD